MQCPSCKAENPEILARHNYTISYSEDQTKWVKNTGYVFYNCRNCEGPLELDEIEEALKQVDEL